MDRKLDFADDAGNSIDGSLTSESVLSWQTIVIPRAVCCQNCCISYRRCTRKAPGWESPAVMFGRSEATVHFSLRNGILPISKAYSYETTACSFNTVSPTLETAQVTDFCFKYLCKTRILLHQILYNTLYSVRWAPDLVEGTRWASRFLPIQTFCNTMILYHKTEKCGFLISSIEQYTCHLAKGQLSCHFDHIIREERCRRISLTSL